MEEALAEGTAPFVPVEKPDAADVVVEIRRCQIQDDGTFIMAGVIDPDAKAGQFELDLLYTPRALRMSISSFPRLLRGVLENK